LQTINYSRNSAWKFGRKIQNHWDSNAFCAVGLLFCRTLKTCNLIGADSHVTCLLQFDEAMFSVGDVVGPPIRPISCTTSISENIDEQRSRLQLKCTKFSFGSMQLTFSTLYHTPTWIWENRNEGVVRQKGRGEKEENKMCPLKFGRSCTIILCIMQPSLRVTPSPYVRLSVLMYVPCPPLTRSRKRKTVQRSNLEVTHVRSD